MLGNHLDRKIVLGLGNLLLGDEGFGIHAVRYLGDLLEGIYPVEYVDGGEVDLDLLHLVEQCSHLLVLDIIDVGKPCGTVLELTRNEIPRFHRIKFLEHQVRFQEALASAKLREHYPTFLHLVGVQPEYMAPGIELSPRVRASLPEAAWRAKSVLQTWFQTERWQPEPDTHPYHM